MDIRVSTEVSHRKDLAGLLNRKGLKGLAVEVGTHRGEFADELLHTWEGEAIALVDTYKPNEDYPHDRAPDRELAENRLAKHKGRFEFKPWDSVEYGRSLEDGTIDFVYLDACHKYESVDMEIKAYWPKIKSGGILSGHDFCFQNPGVCRAVREFAARERGVTIYITGEWYQFWSWYCFKP